MENEYPNNDDAVAWKGVFVNYYKHNAPSKVALVSDNLMNKWHGKYAELYQNLESKYGKLKPKPVAPAPTPKSAAPANNSKVAPPSAGFDKYLMAPLRGGKKSVDSMRDAVGEMRDEYVRLVSEGRIVRFSLPPSSTVQTIVVVQDPGCTGTSPQGDLDYDPEEGDCGVIWVQQTAWRVDNIQLW
eukprot:540285-Prorocentrum_minimum.AAC.6